VPIPDQFQKCLGAERAAVLPKSPMGEAVGHALRNRQALARYTEAGFLAIDNAADLGMKRVAIGRNYAVRRTQPGIRRRCTSCSPG
jgi:hypothetical protein